jgi:flagellar secretion chaperone FliS
MGTALAASAMRHYQHTGAACAAITASPYRLIGMLFDGAIGRLAVARGCLQRGDLGERHAQLRRVLAILQYLRQSLDPHAGQDVAANLAQLYDYMQQRLTVANAQADGAGLDEVSELLRTLRDAWEQLPQPRS